MSDREEIRDLLIEIRDNQRLSLKRQEEQLEIARKQIERSSDQVEKSRRGDAQGVLLALANQLEQHRAAQPNTGYTGFTINDFAGLWDAISDSYDFTVALNAGTPFSYTLTAAPKAGQAGDRCGDLTLDELGSKVAAETNCWK